MVETRAAKKRRIQQELPDLPIDVISSGIGSLLGDRTDWNGLSLVNKETRQTMMKTLPPWPKHFRLGELVEAGNTVGYCKFSPNGEWLVCYGATSASPLFYHRRDGPRSTFAQSQQHSIGGKQLVQFPLKAPNLCATSYEGNLVLWDLAANPMTYSNLGETDNSLCDAKFSPDGRILVSLNSHFGFRNSVSVFSVAQKTCICYCINRGSSMYHDVQVNTIDTCGQYQVAAPLLDEVGDSTDRLSVWTIHTKELQKASSLAPLPWLLGTEMTLERYNDYDGIDVFSYNQGFRGLRVFPIGAKHITWSFDGSFCSSRFIPLTRWGDLAYDMSTTFDIGIFGEDEIYFYREDGDEEIASVRISNPSSENLHSSWLFPDKDYLMSVSKDGHVTCDPVTYWRREE